MEERGSGEAMQQRRGLMVFVVLAVLTAVEYVFAVAIDARVLLIVLLVAVACAKCWAIVVYFMHVARLWRGEGAH